MLTLVLWVDSMRCFAASLVICFFFVPSLANAKDTTIHGFVTDVKSPTSFEIDDYKITRDNSLIFDIDKGKDDDSPATFKPEDIRVGTELEIKGDYDETSKELKAKSIKVFFEDTKTIKRTALLERIPSLRKEDSAWVGEVYADGQRISVGPTTVVTLKPNEAERKKLPRNKRDEAGPLTSLDSVNLDTFIHYEGTRELDGSVQASKIEFRHGELERGEAKLWKQFEPDVRNPDYARFVPGELMMDWNKYRILPDKQGQEYIANLGESLIPAYRKNLPADDPLKIPFRFYLVEAKSFNAACYPNGLVIVHSGVFDVLQNEAQLAFILSHEISHAVEKHAWEEHEYHRTELVALRAGGAFVPWGAIATGMIASTIQTRYARSLENQADRVGLEWMLAAGYDIREAPATWKAVAAKEGERETNPLWDSHDNGTTRRSYLMAELRNNYADVDYSKLKKDSAQFQQIADVVKDFEHHKKKSK
jgi:Peptidase family M48